MIANPHLAYLASAGTGKTFALSVRYLSLLFLGESPNNILAITFTNKATSEMRERILSDLLHLPNQDDTKMQTILAEISTQTSLLPQEILSKQKEVLEKFLSLNNHITTLDSFFGSILRSASLELGIEPDFAIKEFKESARIDEVFIKTLLRDNLIQALISLSYELKDADIDKTKERLNMLYCIDALLPRADYEVFDIQQTEIAIEKYKEKIIQALEKVDADKRALKLFSSAKSVDDLASKKLFMEETLGEHSWFKKYSNEHLEMLFRELKNFLNTWMSQRESNFLHSLFDVYGHYKESIFQEIKSEGVMSFDDVSYLAYKLLYEHISKEFLYFKLDTKFHHILLDEFQDTSMMQFLLLAPMLDEITAGLGQREFKSLFFVGDTKQAIYRFRGGVEEVFSLVANRYDITPKPMKTNYRSAQNITRSVNELFAGHMSDYVIQEYFDGAREGFFKVVQNQKDALIASAIDEAKMLLANGVDIDDIAFLVMTNSDGAMVEEACRQEGIKTILQTSSSLSKLSLVASIVSFVRYLVFDDEIDAFALFYRYKIQDIDLAWFEYTLEPIVVIDRIIKEFKIECDDNVLRLLDFATAFHDLREFLDEFALAKIDIASGSIHGTNIITIHKSKGLEFEHVILIDRLKQKNNNLGGLIFATNNHLFVEKIWLAKSNREAFDEEYKKAKEDEANATKKDTLNMLYVAFTRARASLILIQKDEKSEFAPFNLEPKSVGVIEPSLKKTMLIAQKQKQILTYWGAQKEILDVQEKEPIDPVNVLFGTALHYTLEMMHIFDRDSLEIAIRSTRYRYLHLLKEDGLNAIRKRIIMLLNNATFQALLQDAKALHKEQSISFEGALKQIDLLVEYADNFLIIDYKSSKKEYEKHKEQVNEYVHIVENITHKNAKGAIVYLLEQESEIIFLN
ncbi:MAG: RecB-like helicase [Campylobacterales bacterium]|nr:RecB-like helicase [Campylobacterales bacterium]